MVAPNPFEITQINSAHLELLYNFVTLTSFTLSCNEFIKILWQTNAVKVGLKCEYVMLSILALSALHLARLKLTLINFVSLRRWLYTKRLYLKVRQRCRT